MVLSIICAVSAAWLGFHGGQGFWSSQSRGETGEGLVSVLVLGLALWGLLAALGSAQLFRRSDALPRRRYVAYAVVLAVVGALPPVLGSYWILELVLWSARHGSGS